ncbi:hypothetical protein JNUCC31_08255 [Paenibacillus sp. JNUCC31]|nr:hypothetical protein JNUCC31_08255 [Paenibacillus sp. JNUCC-31]
MIYVDPSGEAKRGEKNALEGLGSGSGSASGSAGMGRSSGGGFGGGGSRGGSGSSSSSKPSTSNNGQATQGTGKINNVYDSIKKAPKYPEGFKGVQNGTKKVNVNNKDVLEKLRNVESGQWKKVYKDGYDASGKEVSIHYFESSSGKVFDVKVKSGWSNN